MMMKMMVIIMMMMMMDHSGGRGIWNRASGYTSKARPGPVNIE